MDDEDYERLVGKKWRLLRNRRGAKAKYYAQEVSWNRHRNKVVSVLAHRLLLNPPKHLYVDHIDGDGLNNQKSNLRPVTHSQNLANSGPRKGKYKGVSYNKQARNWKAYIGLDYKRYHLGHFKTAAEAARAYDRKAYELYGEYAYLNFPDDLHKNQEVG